MPEKQAFIGGAGENPPGDMVGPILASSTTISPTHPIHHVSGTSSITSIALPYAGFLGRITLIADGAWTMTTGGSPGIATAVTAVANQAVDMVYDGALWYPKMID